MVAGSHVPLIPLGDVFDNVGTVAPLHIDGIAAKFGAVIDGHAVLHVTVSEPIQETPFAVIVKVIDCPGVNPVTV